MNKKKLNSNQGFTMVELMISMFVGLVLFAGVMSTFVAMRSTSTETSSYGELQENGRFAISILSDDISRLNFWGDYPGVISKKDLLESPNSLSAGDDCIGGGGNNATFPVNNQGKFNTLWGDLIEADGDALGCFSNTSSTRASSLQKNSDVIQLKRVISSTVAVDEISSDNFYVSSNAHDAAIFNGAADLPIINNARLWQYQHHVYYVKNVKVGDNNVPVLMQGRLEKSKMTFSPLIDGIELIHFLYGVDTDTDPTSDEYGVVNSYIPAKEMTQDLWDGAGGTRIIAVKAFVLARSAVEDQKYKNNNTYHLGDLSFTAEGDGYRRLLFSTTITLYNNSVGSW